MIVNCGMRHSLALILAVLFCAPCMAAPISAHARHQVRVDDTMAEKAIGWLEYVKAGASAQDIHEYFVKHVAATDGCKSIIRHWARFMDWDEDSFYAFVLEGLGRSPVGKPLTNEDGSLTALGRRRMFWTSALENPGRLRADLAAMKRADLADSATILAARWLPKEARIKADFYIVLFGGSNAYSVGDVNGFDLLQLPRKADGTLDLNDALCTFAHEMHHTGFNSCNKDEVADNNQLVAVLAAEGLPTYAIDQYPARLAAIEKNQGPAGKDLAAVWRSHEARLPELYAEAQSDLRDCLEHGKGADEMFSRWMGGLKGPAYVLGADLFALIDRYLGPDSVRAVAGDFRLFLSTYNRAAKLANENGEKRFVFDAEIAKQISES